MLVVLSGVGCGDDDKKSGGKTTSTGSSVSARCERVCDRSATAKCANDDEDECLQECKEAIASTPSACDKELAAVESCTTKAKYECVDKEATPVGCDKQIQAWGDCLAEEVGTGGDPSAPGTDDDDQEQSDACTTCLASECATELSQCTSACQTAFSCITECENNQSCETACVAMSPSARTTVQDIFQCVADNCTAECGDTGTIGLNL